MIDEGDADRFGSVGAESQDRSTLDRFDVPAVTVVVPVKDRQAELRRALASVTAQTLEQVECIVVDDASSVPIEPIVREFGDRFLYVRNNENRGCTWSRIVGNSYAKGRYVAQLDSDNELSPNALERATQLLDARMDIAAVSGLYLFDRGLRVRVSGGERVVGVEEYISRSAPRADCVTVVRDTVVREWLNDEPFFYKEEFALWLMFHLRHRMLYVDEVWGRYHSDSQERLSQIFDERVFRDVVRFVEKYRPILGTRACVPLDDCLRRRWFLLARMGHHDEARVVASWMRERGISRKAAFRRLVVERLGRRGVHARPYVV